MSRSFSRRPPQGSAESLLPQEEIQWVARQHPIFLIRSLLPPGVLLLAVVWLALGTFLESLGLGALWHLPEAMAWLLLPLFGVSLGWMLLAWMEWQNDQYILTSKRVIAVRRLYRLYEQRQEADLRHIQDISIVVPSLWASLWGYGDLKIATASAGGAIEFVRIGAPGLVKEAVFRQQELLRRVQQREEAEHRRARLEETLRARE